MSDNIEKCKLYLVILRKKQVNVYIPHYYAEEAIREFIGNTFGKTKWHGYKEVE